MKNQKKNENTVRKWVNLTPEQVATIEYFARQNGETFSAFMRAAALARLQTYIELRDAKIVIKQAK